MAFPRINYVVGCWSGGRIKETNHLIALSPHADMSPLSYLAKQIGCLTRYKHSLSQITFAIPYNPFGSTCPHHPSYMAEAERLDGTFVGGAKVRTLWRERNDGQSYASWSYASRTYKDVFDYYIFVEDDYVPVVDDFDKIMINDYDSKTCDYLCTFKVDGIFVTNGIIGKRGLAKFNYDLPYHHDKHMFMQTFLYSMTTDMLSPPYTCSPYYGDHKGHSGIMFLGEGSYLLAPTQMVDPESFTVKEPENRIQLRS